MRLFIPLICFALVLPMPAAAHDASAEDQELLAQQRAALLLEIGGTARAGRVLYRLETAAATLCEGAATVNPGFATAAGGRFPDALREAAKTLGYDRQARVIYVADESPAAQAGLQAGDVILAVNGQSVSEGPDAHEDLDTRLARVEPGARVALAVSRADAGIGDLEFVPVHTCRYSPRLLRSHVVNAAAIDRDMHLTTAMLDFLESDAELAAVLAHEIAHGLMSHMAKRNGNRMLGKMLDVVLGLAAGPAGSLLVQLARPGERAGESAYARDFEREADFVAMHVLALAGYSIRGTPSFWRRLSVEFPLMDERSYLATHPADAERILVQALTVEEIEARIAADTPLLPELARRVSAIRRGGE